MISCSDHEVLAVVSRVDMKAQFNDANTDCLVTLHSVTEKEDENESVESKEKIPVRFYTGARSSCLSLL